uniref:NAC domain-containing protein 8 n=1 Tax=Anthurium amnicola TaxID=1678845 RepID=A0A1D1XE08_9ARAE
MSKAWLVNGRGIAKKVKNVTIFYKCPVKDGGTEAIRECPNCKHYIDNSDVSLEWPGLPTGVKFDPSDIELVEHLAGKVGHGNSKPHVFLDEFIPTLEEDEGICYTHPENLPGVKKDGSSAHFFHKTFNAYATGRRKRRKIHNGHNLSKEAVRWHKTGKTKLVIENGVQKGVKKILVLYKSSKNGLKPVKTNWVMHQYHLGTEEDERPGELVVSKIFFQLKAKQAEKLDKDPANVDAEVLMAGVSPRTPKTNAPCPPRSVKNCQFDEGDEDNTELSTRQDKNFEGPQAHFSQTNLGNSSKVCAGESQVVEDSDDLVVSLLCDEVLDPLFPMEESGLRHSQCSLNDFGRDDALGKDSVLCGFPDLDNIDTDTPPDFNLADLQFGSQDSLSWLDWLGNSA